MASGQKRFFASDNAAGAHSAVMAALAAANDGHAMAYGADPWTARAVARLRELFDPEAEVVFTFGGTGANIVALASVIEPWQGIACAESAHLARDECGAPERWLGAKLLTLPSTDGKIDAARIEGLLEDRGVVHRVQPGAVSISQPTEWGTLYTLAELQSLGAFCRAHDLFLHVDGARLANAVAAIGAPPGEMITGCGVDLLSFGGTKNGMLFGEAVLVFGRARNRGLAFCHKQGAQLPSKTRFVAAQFEALLDDGLWLRNAGHANAMATRLGEGIAALDGVDIVQPVETNAAFIRVPPRLVEPLTERFHVALWRSEPPILRVMTSFDTTEEDVDEFVAAVGSLLKRR